MAAYDDRHSPDEKPVVDRVTFLADDGRELAGTWFRPTRAVRGAAVIVPAMGTRSTFYADFATWLAASGVAALTFDFRGMEGPAQMRAERGDLIRWAGDAASALETVVDGMPDGTPVTWVGHSLGGQILPFARHDLVTRALFIASGLGYYRWAPAKIRWKAPILFRAVVPLAIGLAGYYPGGRIGALGDLPPNVMRQWTRWCRSPSYFGVDIPRVADRLAQVTIPIDMLSFTDDELLTARSHEALEQLYVGARLEIRRLSPAEMSRERIGHFGFFRASMQPVWEDVVLPRLAID